MKQASLYSSIVQGGGKRRAGVVGSTGKEHNVSSFLGRGKTMGSRTKVRNFTYQAIAASDTNKKLDAIAHAIYELADLVDNKLNHIEQKLR
jgi:hypothetical protein